MICDCHAPVFDESDYVPMLAETAQNLGFDKLCIHAGSERYGMVGNDGVLKHADRYPDLFVAFGYLDAYEAPGRVVERLVGRGFAALRIGVPPVPYDSPELFPVYEAASALGVPLFFATGYVPPSRMDRALDVRVSRMRPSGLDTIARQFEELQVIGTGLGGPWFEEGTATLRWNENAFFDLSGASLRNRGAGFFRTLLGPRQGSFPGTEDSGGAWSGIVFGSGSHYNDLASVEADYQRLFRSLALPQEVVSDIMGRNMIRVLGLETDA